MTSPAPSGTLRVGWIGTGVMGASMCSHLVDAGHEVRVSTRTRERAAAVLERGATWADTPAEAAEGADAVFSIVGFPSDVREVLLGERGALSNAKPGAVLVDMTTSEPSLAREIYEAARAAGVHSLDAPVSGGDVGARNAKLSIMVGGDAEALAIVDPLFRAMGTFIHQGPAGSGQHTKMVNQILISGTMVGICEGLVYGYRAGLDLDTVLEAVSGGAAGSVALTNLATRALRGDYAPGFFVDHFIKDMEIALGEARRMNLALPGLALVHELYLALRAQRGNGRDGTQALVFAVAHLSSVDWAARPLSPPASA